MFVLLTSETHESEFKEELTVNCDYYLLYPCLDTKHIRANIVSGNISWNSSNSEVYEWMLLFWMKWHDLEGKAEFLK